MSPNYHPAHGHELAIRCVAHGCTSHIKVGVAASPMNARAAIAQTIILTSELRSIDHHAIPTAPSASSRLVNFTYPKGQEAHFAIR